MQRERINVLIHNLFHSEQRQSQALKSIFGNFAHQGNPPGNLPWRPYTVQDRYYFEIDSGTEGKCHL